jgi:outer membrane protein assembly factor BamB
MSPAGADVRDWIGATLDPEPSPTLSRLPASGRLLVSSPRGVWVVQEDGGLRRLGDYTSAGWSPRGLFVAAARGRRLYAVEPDGTVRWSIARPGPVGRPAWSLGDGFRVAYLERRSLRVATGDGKSDRLLARRVARVTPAWRPGRGQVLSYATPGGRIVTRDADSGRVLWEEPTPGRPLALEWAGPGRLVALTPARLQAYGRDGRPGAGRGLPAAAGREMAVHPSGRLVAVTGGAGGVAAVELDRRAGRAPRRLFDGQGEFSGLAWSPDGRWLLAVWRDADQWVFIRSPASRRGSPAPRRVVTFSNIARQLDPGRATFARIDGWCCR